MSGKAQVRKNRALRSHKTGLPPGALVAVGEAKTERLSITLIEYGAEEIVERSFDSIAEALDYPARLPTLWFNIYGLPDAESMRALGRRFQLHPLVLEDILNTDQRPKVDDYGDTLYLVVRFFDYDRDSMRVSSDQVSIVLGKEFVLTFQERPTGSFDPVRERLRQARGQIRRLAADYLAYALLDALVDRYFLVLEQIGERTELLEDELMHRATPGVLHTLHQLKRETLTLRRAVWPLREVVATLARGEGDFFRPETLPYLRDVYDHTVHVIESLEAIRDLLAGMLDIYLSSLSHRVNQEVRALTVIALIFMPATMISGIFGMNFRVMPLLENPFGFYIALGLIAGIAVTLGVVFWRRRWLG
ncbi:MAG: magnesium/cobalt transporter CorA [Betaproteobacteria bacterium]|nr:magnesium/cobalt transporter CorA [Betaproteobacteria bacterium]